jgi:aminoglycoside phosphotransferase (APT) family kinase protein
VPDPLRAAEAKVAATRPDDDRLGLVHGDLRHGNALWDGGRLTAVLDRDCAGVGPAGIDPGSLRCDAAWCHGVEAAGHILRGWETQAGRPASDVRPPRTHRGDTSVIAPSLPGTGCTR